MNINIYASSGTKTGLNAGAKAPNDIEKICAELGWKKKNLTKLKREQNFFIRYCKLFALVLNWLDICLSVKKNSIFLYQYPMYYGVNVASKFVPALTKKGVKTTILIHDIESLRKENATDNELKKEIDFFNKFKYIICHNKKMAEFLEQQGIPGKKLISLEIFDYLCTQIDFNKKYNQATIAIAGNLDPAKCSYIYELAIINPELSVNLYGANYEERNIKNINYCGSFKPDELPGIINAMYGIVWDGNSCKKCEGPMGNYLKYNNPHKLSLFMAAGIPVITWQEAAIADFIIYNNCGFAIDSLENLFEKIKDVTDEEYNEKVRNCRIIGEKLTFGVMFKSVISKITELA